MICDAWVFCDCLERGRLKRPVRPEWRVYVHDDGCRESAAAELPHLAAFGHWTETACDHDYGILLHRRLGSLTALEAAWRDLDTHHLSLPEVGRLLGRLARSHVLCLAGEELSGLAAELERAAAEEVMKGQDWLRALRDVAAPAAALGKPMVVQGG